MSKEQRIEKRLKNYSLNSENLVNKFIDIIFILDHLNLPINHIKKRRAKLSFFI